MVESCWRGRRVLIMGLGRFGGGADAARYLADQGARVRITDRASATDLAASLASLRDREGLSFSLGGHEPADFDWAEVVVVNPAIADSHPLIGACQAAGRTVTTAVNLFLAVCPAAVIAITGANGKSTTTALTAHLLGALPGRRVWLSGNIGHRPLLGSLAEIRAQDLVVLELSSFQTERLPATVPTLRAALLTNLTPNHLDRHGTVEAYAAAKERLFRCQPRDAESPCLSVFCADDAVARAWFERYRDQEGRRCLSYRADDLPEALAAACPLPGRANRTNLAGAWTLAQAWGLGVAAATERLGSFEALPHRLARVLERRGVAWYDDSIATTPESTAVALAAFEQPKILIAGGYDKGIDFTDLGRVIRQRAKALVLLGQTAERLRRAVAEAAGPAPQVAVVTSLEEAVRRAGAWAQPGDVVLLSPACASYDMFTNFQERGRRFAALAEQLG